MSDRDNIQARLDALQERHARLKERADERRAKQRALRDEIDADRTLQEQIRERAVARSIRLTEIEAMIDAEEIENNALDHELADIQRTVDGLPPLQVAQA